MTMRQQAASRSVFSLFASCLLVAAQNAVHAQEDIIIGERISIFSEILDEERTIRVGKPFNYDQGDERYPVMFVLDGDVHFHHTTGLTGFLAFNQFVPSLLVVAIENTQRARDLTPPSEDPEVIAQVPTHGGAENFRSFLAEELIPWLEENYRTHPYRILVGHSLGGLFAIDSLISRTELFNAYIAISPSLQWDGQRTVGRAEAFFDDTQKLNASLFMTVGNEGRALLGGVRKLAGVLDEKAPEGFEWHFEHMPLETHGSVPLRSTYQGLEFIFSDWVMRDLLQTYNRYGIEAVERFYAERDQKYGYDGGVPEPAVASIGSELLQAGRLDELHDLLVRYRDTVQAPPPVLMRLAGGFRERGEADRAIGLYRQALEVNPNIEEARQALTELGSDFSDLLP
jgi:uncharacterized protein